MGARDKLRPMLDGKSGRTILITGGTGTLGAAITQGLCSATQSTLNGSPRPLRVIANYRRDDKRAKQLQIETGCELWCADVGDENSVRAMFEAIGPLYGVVHLAAVARDGLIMNTPHAAWQETLRINANGAFLVTRSALEYVESGGRLILFASRAGETGNRGQSAYAASKAAVIALAKCASREAAGRIAVNVLCPGFVRGTMSEAVAAPGLAWQRARSADGELGHIEPVVSAVQWLLSEGARAVSGQVIHCDQRLW